MGPRLHGGRGFQGLKFCNLGLWPLGGLGLWTLELPGAAPGLGEETRPGEGRAAPPGPPPAPRPVLGPEDCWLYWGEGVAEEWGGAFVSLRAAQGSAGGVEGAVTPHLLGSRVPILGVACASSQEKPPPWSPERWARVLGAGIPALGLSCPKLAVPRLVPPVWAVGLSDQRAVTVPGCAVAHCRPSSRFGPCAGPAGAAWPV